MLSILKKSSRKFFILLFFIVFCFCFKISNANALALKQYDTITNLNNTEITGTINSSGSNRLIFQWDPKQNTNNYEYIGLRISPLYSTQNLGTVNSSTADIECEKWQESPANSNNYICTSWKVGVAGNQTNNLLINQGDVGFSGYITYTGQGGGINSPCFYTPDFEGVFICKYVPNTNTLVYYVNNFDNLSMHYKVGISNQIIWFNSDSLEIANAIDNMTIQQTQTNTNIQNIYQYQQNDNVSDSTTDYQNGVSSLTQSINSQIQGVNDLTQIVLMPITLFMNLSTDTCTPLHLQVPFVNYSFDLPCMKAIYTTYFGGFYGIFTAVLSAITCYWISIRSASLIKDILDCDNDRIEVVDL